MNKPPSSGVMRMAEMIKVTGMSESTISAKNSKSSPYYDPEFPQKFKLADEGRAVGWLRTAVEAWVEKRSTAPVPVRTNKHPATKRLAKPKAVELRPAPPAKPKRQPAKKSLAEAVIQGSDLVAHIIKYMELETWTPAMGCLIAAGIAPEIDVEEIPRTLTGKDLCDNDLRPLDAKVRVAMRLLNEWNGWAEDEDPIPTRIKPSEFLYWCWDDQIDTPWLQLIHQIYGSGDPQSESISNAQLALLMHG